MGLKPIMHDGRMYVKYEDYLKLQQKLEDYERLCKTQAEVIKEGAQDKGLSRFFKEDDDAQSD